MNKAGLGNLEMTPLGAGDLIDRAVRLYRGNFVTLIRIASLPVIVSAIGSVLITIGWRGFYLTGAEASFALYLLSLLTGAALWIIGVLLTLMAMGGAARNLVRHLLWHEPVTVAETYRSVRERFWSLLAAITVVAVVVFLIFFVVSYLWLTLASFAMLGGILVATVSPIFGVIVGIVLGLAVTLVSLWLFFFLAGKFAYVPQVLLVEGQGVFSSIGRSASLASGNAKRLGALVIFATFATYSALMILWFPLIWYARTNGIEVFSFEPDVMPIWYSVTLQLIWQLSFILLAPIWMLGLSVMYVDERVRHEAYDIELMAARQLGEMPALVNPSVNPIRPALGAQQQQTPPDFAPPRNPTNYTTLGLR